VLNAISVFAGNLAVLGASVADPMADVDRAAAIRIESFAKPEFWKVTGAPKSYLAQQRR
jgi:hypothetical protein